MAKCHIDESVEGCFDIFAEADFLQPLGMKDTTSLLRLLSDLLAEGAEANRF